MFHAQGLQQRPHVVDRESRCGLRDRGERQRVDVEVVADAVDVVKTDLTGQVAELHGRAGGGSRSVPVGDGPLDVAALESVRQTAEVDEAPAGEKQPSILDRDGAVGVEQLDWNALQLQPGGLLCLGQRGGVCRHESAERSGGERRVGSDEVGDGEAGQAGLDVTQRRRPIQGDDARRVIRDRTERTRIEGGADGEPIGRTTVDECAVEQAGAHERLDRQIEQQVRTVQFVQPIRTEGLGVH